MLHTFVDWPKLSDITGEYNSENEFQIAEAMKMKVEREWAYSYIERDCQICGSVNLFVRVDPITEPQRSLLVLAAKCPQCGLDINDRERYLAECHVGELSQDEVETFLRDIGE
jgi:hypothetical protein